MYYVAQHDETGYFAVLNQETGQIGYTSIEAEADWHELESVVQGYINRFNLTMVKPKPGTGLNHPPKPPISAM